MLNEISLKPSAIAIECVLIGLVKTDMYISERQFHKHTHDTCDECLRRRVDVVIKNKSTTRGPMVKATYWVFTSSPVDLELNRDFNGDDYEYEDEAKLVIFPDHFEIPLPNIEELPALVSESLLHGSLSFVLVLFFSPPCTLMGRCTQWFLRQHPGWSVLSGCFRFIFREESVPHCHVF